jgi:hypothetical protein
VQNEEQEMAFSYDLSLNLVVDPETGATLRGLYSFHADPAVNQRFIEYSQGQLKFEVMYCALSRVADFIGKSGKPRKMTTDYAAIVPLGELQRDYKMAYKAAYSRAPSPDKIEKFIADIQEGLLVYLKRTGLFDNSIKDWEVRFVPSKGWYEYVEGLLAASRQESN